MFQEMDAVKEPKRYPNFPINLKHGSVSLNEHHDFYYQVQGQMNIYDVKGSDVLFRRRDPYDMIVIRVFRERAFWNATIPKLNSFYFNVIFPELALPRWKKYPGIREPISIVNILLYIICSYINFKYYCIML